MSGLAAGIRLAMYDKDVLIVERHNALGGLNSFYSFAGRKYDVGLHAVTNYVPAGTKRAPLTKLLRQLRLKHDELGLAEQHGSRIAFPGIDLRFTNDFNMLESEIATHFPTQIDGFRSLVAFLETYDETALDAGEESARAVLATYLTDPVLTDMLMLPLCYYGSSRESDMDLSQFAIMFRALFLEGFARPFEGVRRIIRLLRERYRSLGGQLKVKCGVRRIRQQGDRATALELDSGETISATHVLSSIGWAETLALCGEASEQREDKVGNLAFVETINVLDRQPVDFGWDETIIFFNDAGRFEYRCPEASVDPRSGVICLPNNYRYTDGAQLEDGWLRVTALANYKHWAELRAAPADAAPSPAYLDEKKQWFEQLQAQALRFLPGGVTPKQLASSTLATDMFTPTTVTRYTGHLGGAIYGAPRKNRTGSMPLRNLYLCGTDQGFLGIIGAMLIGNSMANTHILGKS